MRKVEQPTLFIQATQDPVLTVELAHGMEEHVPRMTTRQVATSHWALWEKPAEVNAAISEWLQAVVFGNKSTL